MNPIKAFLYLIYFIFVDPILKLVQLIYYIFINSYMLKIYKILGIYICYIVCHYIASHLYIEFCVPSTFIGLIQSSFVAVLPHCQALRWIIYNGGNTLSLMWTILGTWLILKIGNYLTKVCSEEI
jgi:hypothetical protein